MSTGGTFGWGVGVYAESALVVVYNHEKGLDPAPKPERKVPVLYFKAAALPFKAAALPFKP